MDRLVKQLQGKGIDKSSAYAIATSKLQKSGNLKKGTNKATSKGAKRGNMTASLKIGHLRSLENLFLNINTILKQIKQL